MTTPNPCTSPAHLTGKVAGQSRTLILVFAALVAFGPAPALAGVTGKPGKTFQKVTNSGAYKWLETRKGDCSNCMIKGVTLHVDRIGVQVNSPTTDLTIDGLKADLRAPTKGGDFPAAIEVADFTGPMSLTVRNSRFSGFRMVPVPGKYNNGDGLDCDKRDGVLTVTDSTSSDNSDGGFDTKCISTLDRLTAMRNGRNYRIWGNVRAGTLTSADPRHAHLWISKGADGVIGKLVVRGGTGAPVIQSDAEGLHDVFVRACDIDLSAPAKLLAGVKNTRLHLGPTCKADAKGYAINTVKGHAINTSKDFDAGEVLSDKDGDGRIVLSDKTAARLKLPRGTVLRSLGGKRYEVIR